MSTISPAEVARLQNLRNRIAEIDRNDTGNSAGASDMTQRVLSDFREKVRRIEAAWPNDRLLAEYKMMVSEPLNAPSDDLLSEIRHRNLII